MPFGYNVSFQVAASHPSCLSSAPCGGMRPSSQSKFRYLGHTAGGFPDLGTVVVPSWQNLSLNQPINPSDIISSLQISQLSRTVYSILSTSPSFPLAWSSFTSSYCPSSNPFTVKFRFYIPSLLYFFLATHTIN